MKRTVLTAVLAAGFASQAIATEVAAPAVSATAAASATVAPQAAAYQVLRTGDRAMTCEQLSAEANTLNATLMQQQADQSKQASRGKFGRGLMGGVAGGAMAGVARFGLARSMVGGALSPIVAQAAVGATDQASMAAGQAIANRGTGEGAAPTIMPEQQRMNYLLGIYKEKGC